MCLVRMRARVPSVHVSLIRDCDCGRGRGRGYGRGRGRDRGLALGRT